MSKRSDKLADLFFEGIPYGEETMRAKIRIKSRLAEMAEKLPFSALVENYHSLESLAILGGYAPEDVARWESGAKVLDGKGAISRFRGIRWIAYITAALSSLSFSLFLWSIYYAFSPDADFFKILTLFLLAVGGMIAFLILVRKRTQATVGNAFDGDAYLKLRASSDRYAKRLLHSVAVFAAAVFAFEMTELNFYIFGSSKAAELAESVLSNYLLVAIPLFFLMKNILIVRTLRVWISLPERKKLRTHLFGMILFSALYWTLCMIVMIIFRNGIAYPANYVVYSAAVFFAFVAFYDFTLRKKLCYRNVVLNKTRVAAVLIAILLMLSFLGMNRDTWYTQPYINSVPYVGHAPTEVSYNEGTGVYTMTASGDFKILHLTDIHLGGSLFSYKKDILALKACYQEIKYTRPDLVIVTGDLCFPMGIMSMSFNNSAPVQQFAAFMRNIGIPWAFTFGNHDTENLASMKKEDLVEVYKSLSFKTSGSLLYPYVQPKITGRNNQLIEVRKTDGSLITALFLIDSNAYTGEGFSTYDYIHDDQVEWYSSEVRRLQREKGGQISSLAFFHIPLKQYRTAYELYLEGSDEVTYHFGVNGESFHKVSCSDYDSAIFEAMVSLGSTTGTFCGHDHYNNSSITYRGIRLTYGMSIDYLAIPGIAKDTAQRGAEVITLHEDSTWDVVQVPLSSIAD